MREVYMVYVHELKNTKNEHKQKETERTAPPTFKGKALGTRLIKFQAFCIV